MGFPAVAIYDPNSGNAMGITSVGAISVNTVNIASTTVVGGSIVVTLASVQVIGGTVQIEGGASVGPLATAPVSNTSVAGTTAYVSVKTGAGRFFGLTWATSGAGTVLVTDGSGGTPIFATASTLTSAAAGYVGCAPAGNIFNTGLVVLGTASSPAVIVHYS